MESNAHKTNLLYLRVFGLKYIVLYADHLYNGVLTHGKIIESNTRKTILQYLRVFGVKYIACYGVDTRMSHTHG
jgi:hypothetical protein